MDYQDVLKAIESLIAQWSRMTGSNYTFTVNVHELAVDLAGRGVLTHTATGYAWTLDINSHAFRHAFGEAIRSLMEVPRCQ
jgi:hypothetical protein